MVICLTGFSCTGKTTTSRFIASHFNYSHISVREISHSLAQIHGYSRTREWLEAVSIDTYLWYCREAIMEKIMDSAENYIIDDMFDLMLWQEIKNNYDSILIAFTLPEQIRTSRMGCREGKDTVASKQELEFLDGYKQIFGINTVMELANITIDVTDKGPSELADILYQSACNYTSETVFYSELNSFRSVIDKAISGNHVISLLHDFNTIPFIKQYTDAFLKYCEGGKRIRAYLVKLGCDLTGETCDEKIIAPALSYELFQAGVLIHDDIIDESTTRRNNPTMHIMLGNNHNAVSKAICIGDLGIFLSTEIISNSKYDKILINRAINHQMKIFKLTIAGELKDIELSDKTDYSFKDIIEMYQLKTSWYTIIGPLQLGAILGGATQELLELIEVAGSAMGVAFQIKDDIIGVFGDETVIGKSNLSDIQEGKKTVLTEYFLNHATVEEQEQFNKYYGNKQSGVAELAIIRNLMLVSGSLNYAEKLCNDYIEKAKACIYEIPTSHYCKRVLIGFLGFLNNRQY